VICLLRIWGVRLCLIGSIRVKFSGIKKSIFVLMNTGLGLFLVLRFRLSDYIFFYFGFECCLIPVFVIVLGWGYQPERVQAGVYLIFYTLFGSLPLFFVILHQRREEGNRYIGFREVGGLRGL
jgi:NADH-ubiquinone oxidoreductase chain 4